MVKKSLILIGFLFITLVGAVSYEHPIIAFCEHRGYNATPENVPDIPFIDGTCYFGGGISCKLSDFYNKNCGLEYQNEEIACRTEGQVVFTTFEHCCEGLEVVTQDYVLAQSTCKGKEETKSRNLLCLFFNIAC